MHKVKFLFKMHCVLLFSSLMFAENIESAYNFNLDDCETSFIRRSPRNIDIDNTLIGPSQFTYYSLELPGKVIKKIRLQKLNETDYMANSDYTMPDDVKTWRQTMRDIPANYTTEAKYDELLDRDDTGKLTHSIWSKP